MFHMNGFEERKKKDDRFAENAILFEKGKLYCLKKDVKCKEILELLSHLRQAQIQDNERKNDAPKHLGVMFNKADLQMTISALDNVLCTIFTHCVSVHQPREYALALLAKVGISIQKANHKIKDLSMSEQRRVSIAQAISHSPDYIFAEDPTHNLNDASTQYIMEIFKNLAGQGKCIVIATRSEQVHEYADEVYLLE